jgi:hypothetical protein
MAKTLFLNSKLAVPEKSLNRMFEAIPGYHIIRSCIKVKKYG